MKKKILETSLQPADIILTRDKSSPTSWVVRIGTLSPYSHAILYVGGSSFIDSDSGGVHANNLQRLLFSGNDDVAVLRTRTPLSHKEQTEICDYARSKVGHRYSTKEAVLAAKRIVERKPTDRQFCSRLVAQAFHYAGICLVENPDFCSPDDLLNSPKLQRADAKPVSANSADLEFAERPNPLLAQEQITNRLNADMSRLANCEIGTLEQIVELACNRPDLDEQANQILSASGYLSMWQFDMELNPYRYHVDEFLANVPEQQQAELAMRHLADEPEIQRRFQINLQVLTSAFSQRPRKTIAAYVSLYETLLKISKQRAAVCEAVLRLHGKAS